MGEVSATDSTSERRPQFGNRTLKNADDVFKHNAWDNVEWDEEQLEAARQKVRQNSGVRLGEDALRNLESDADKHWDSFYNVHQNRFFKDRHWLFTEFPELAPDHEPTVQRVYPEGSRPETNAQDAAVAAQHAGAETHHIEASSQLAEKSKDSQEKPKKTTILEIGCGVGNTIFPILQYSRDPNLFVYGCDFSTTAIEIMKKNPSYDTKRCNVFVLDATVDIWEVPFEENSLDIIVLIFVLSAIDPKKMGAVADKIARYLRPGGLLVFRDYGRYDMAQLRFKSGRCIADNFYARSDNTRVYFFSREEVSELFAGRGLIEEQNLVDRRLQVNRGQQITMYRVWIQAKYRKPL